jgi:hypothetical protein
MEVSLNSSEQKHPPVADALFLLTLCNSYDFIKTVVLPFRLFEL